MRERKYDFPLHLSLPSKESVKVGDGVHEMTHLSFDPYKTKVKRVAPNGFYRTRIHGKSLVYVSFDKQGLEFYRGCVSNSQALELVVASEDVQAVMLIHARRVRAATAWMFRTESEER